VVPCSTFFWLSPNHGATAKLRKKDVHIEGNQDISLWALLKLFKTSLPSMTFHTNSYRTARFDNRVRAFVKWTPRITKRSATQWLAKVLQQIYSPGKTYTYGTNSLLSYPVANKFFGFVLFFLKKSIKLLRCKSEISEVRIRS